MNPLHQPVPHRVYLHASLYGDRWFVQYLEADLKTPVGRLYTYSRIDQVSEILKRADCSEEEWSKFEEGVRMWSIGACFISLTTSQILLRVVSTMVFSVVAFQLQAQAPPTPGQILQSHGVSDSTPALRDALKNPDAEVRSLAAGMLAFRKDAESIPLIQEAPKNERSPGIKINLASALASLNEWEGHRSLIETCNDKTIEPSVRLEAANRILSLGGNDCTSAVADILENKPDPPSRELGLQYLHRITNFPILLMPKLQAATIESLKTPRQSIVNIPVSFWLSLVIKIRFVSWKMQ